MKADAAETIENGRGGGGAAVYRYIRRVWPALGGALPGKMTEKELTSALRRAIEREPWLVRATPESLARAVVTAARLGTPLGEPGGRAWLIPYRNRESGRLECLLGLRQGETEKG